MSTEVDTTLTGRSIPVSRRRVVTLSQRVGCPGRANPMTLPRCDSPVRSVTCTGLSRRRRGRPSSSISSTSGATNACDVSLGWSSSPNRATAARLEA